jgi:hypothetical protein
MWLCPSLSRPGNLKRLAEAWEVTKSQHRLVVRLHEGDPLLDSYFDHEWPEEWELKIGPMEKAPGACRWALHHYPSEEFYGFIGDDVVPRTFGWDAALARRAAGGGIAYPNDGIHGQRLCTHPCIDGELIRTVGWWALPGLDHNFMDTVWHAIGYRMNRLRYCADVYFEHLHPIIGKAEDDAVYRRGRERYAEDEERFRLFFEKELDSICGKISKRNLYKEPLPGSLTHIRM